MNIRIDVSHLHKASAFRGVGVYTDFLVQHLKQICGLHVHVYTGGRKQKTDIVHYPYFDLFFHTLPLYKEAKTVVTIHDVIPLIFPQRYKPGLKGMIRFFLQLVSLHTVSAVITDSECSKRDIMKYLGMPKEKIHVVYLAGNPGIQRQTSEVVRRVSLQYNLPQKYVLYVGDINYNKNLPRCIEAFSKLPNEYSFVMVGRSLKNIDIPEGVALHETIQENKVDSRVLLLTEVPKDPASDLAAIFTRASLYIQPSLYEGFGLSVLDALQCGVPVVSSNTSSLPEIGETIVEYCNPYDSEDMARVMINALSKKQSMIYRKTLEKHAEHFQWEKTAKKTANIYEKVMKR